MTAAGKTKSYPMREAGAGRAATEGHAQRVCRRCMLQVDDGGAEAQLVQEYLGRLKPEAFVPDEVYHKRIRCCQDCEHRLGATCQACGCYIEFRANVRNAACPRKKWQKI